MPGQRGASPSLTSGMARHTSAMVVIYKGPGDRTRVKFMPGCLIWSIVLSIGLTVLLNVLIRLL
jgi:hypothetical protein